MTAPAAQADPAPAAPVTNVTDAGPFSVPAPNGVCAVQITIAGGAGGDALGGNTQGHGAVISLGALPISPGQLVEGAVGGVGADGGAAGVNGGGEGSVTGGHRGGGGGGYTEVKLNGGPRLALAGGGGGSGGGHVPAKGHGGDAGVPTGGGAFSGQDGMEGDDGAHAAPGGGKGGTGTAGGAGGVHPDDATLNGFPGTALQGGNGGNEPSLDGGAGGGGGLFGGGGGASTINDGVGGAGGGGGSSFVAASAPFQSAGLNDGGGYATLTWLMCDYDLALTKTSGSNVYESGVPVSYTVKVVNNGPQKMAIGDTVTVTDDKAAGGTLTGVSSTGGSGNPITCTPAVGAAIPASGIIECSRAAGSGQRGLDVGEELKLTYSQSFTGDTPVVNTASVTDRANPANNTGSATLDPAKPSLDLVKSAEPAKITKAGQKVVYSFVVTNTGNIAMHDIKVTEGAFSGTGKLGKTVCPATPATLAPGAKTVCKASYVATQADVDAGEVTNTANAGGTTPGGNSVVSNDSSAKVIAPPAPALDLVKSSDVEKVTHAGETVHYTFKLTNSGNVTLTDLAVTEGSFSGTGAMSPIVCPTAPLAPGASTDCKATYEVTKADLKHEKLTNTASADALAPNGDIVESNVSKADVAIQPRAILPNTGASTGLLWIGLGGAGLLGAGATVLTVDERRRRKTVA